MSITLHAPRVHELAPVMAALASWQVDGTALQLHPGDIGWHLCAGPDATAAVLRSWSRDGQLLAIGMFDGPELLRLAIAPHAQQDADLTDVLVQNLRDQGSGSLTEGVRFLEVPNGVRLRGELLAAGWATDEAWTPLELGLSAPIGEPGVRIEVVGPELAPTRVAVHRESFERSTFTMEHWRAMRALPDSTDTRCLLAFADDGTAVAATTIWMAGAGLAGLIEPLGVGREHRGHGYGPAITRAGVAMTQELGASRALVATPSDNTSAVATYMSAGFTALPQRLDLRRPA